MYMRELATRRHALTSILSVLASSISRQALAVAPSGNLASQVAEANAQRFARTTPAVVRPFVFEGSNEWQLVAAVEIPMFTKVASYPVEVLSSDDGRVEGSRNYAVAIYQEDDFGITTGEYGGLRGIPTPLSMALTFRDGLPSAGMYANEPNESEGPNCVLSFPQSRRQPEVGDIESGYLVTTRRVKKGEALTWCYGDLFQRNYKTGCASSSW